MIDISRIENRTMPRSRRLTRRGSGREGRRQRGGEVLGERSDGTNGGMERRKRWEKTMKTWRFNQAKGHFGIGFHHDNGKTPCNWGYNGVTHLLSLAQCSKARDKWSRTLLCVTGPDSFLAAVSFGLSFSLFVFSVGRF